MGKAKRVSKATDVHVSLDVFDYSNNKLCNLFDSGTNAEGQAYEIVWTKELGGWKQITFRLPYSCGPDNNFRWDYIKNEYLLRLKYGNIVDWYIIHEPRRTKNGRGISNEVTCSHRSSILKTKNLYMSFESGSGSGVLADEINGVGPIDELLEQALMNTGWELGEVDTLYEKDGETEKIRSFSSGGKEGAYKLVTDICALFGAYPEFIGDTQKVNIHAENNTNPQIELMIGRDLDSIDVSNNSEDIITRLYVEGDYGQDKYVGIDDVNPTGLNYLLNFDYYREIGLFTNVHEQAYEAYMTDITEKTAAVRTAYTNLLNGQNTLTDLWGVFTYVLFILDDGEVTRTLTGVSGKRTITNEDVTINPEDELYIYKSDGTERKVTVGDNGVVFAGDDAYAIKYITPSVGQAGVKQTAIDAAKARRDTAQQKLDAIIATGFPIDQDESLDTNVQTRIRKQVKEYQQTISDCTEQIETLIYGQEETDDQEATDGYYEIMRQAIEQRVVVGDLEDAYNALVVQQNNIESDFIIAMGDLLKDGYWANDNYAIGQEQALYDDAVEKMKILSRPKVTYKLGFASLLGAIGYTEDQLKLNATARIYDKDLGVNDILKVSKITRYIDEPSKDTVEVTNESVTLGGVSLDSILSRMTALSNLIQQKNTLYDRAAAISSDGTVKTDVLEGTINLLTTQISSALSNWYTDEQGNLVFESATGQSAMMLTGEGYMIADGRKDDGTWNWRTKLQHWFSQQ